MDKLYGICYSVILGDVFGSSYEGKKAEEIDITTRGSWKIGRYTDDTVMTLGTIISINMNNGNIDPEHMAVTYARMYDGRRRYGSGTAKILKYIRDHNDEWATYYNKIHKGGSYANGGLMRIAPIAVYCLSKGYTIEDNEAEIDNCIKCCLQCTHIHPFSIEACRIYVRLLMKIVWDINQTDLLRTAKQFMESHRMESKMIIIERKLSEMSLNVNRINGYINTKDYGEFDDTFYLEVCDKLVDSKLHAIDTLAIVLWTYLYGIRFKKIRKNPILFYQKIISAGGDTDTNAAILGGLIGAKYGMWFDTITHWKNVEHYQNINVIIDSFIRIINN